MQGWSLLCLGVSINHRLAVGGKFKSSKTKCLLSIGLALLKRYGFFNLQSLHEDDLSLH